MRFSMLTTVHATGGAKSPAQTLDFLREQVILGDEYLVGYAHRGVSRKMTLRNLGRFAIEVTPYFENREAEHQRAAVG